MLSLDNTYSREETHRIRPGRLERNAFRSASSAFIDRSRSNRRRGPCSLSYENGRFRSLPSPDGNGSEGDVINREPRGSLRGCPKRNRRTPHEMLRSPAARDLTMNCHEEFRAHHDAARRARGQSPDSANPTEPRTPGTVKVSSTRVGSPPPPTRYLLYGIGASAGRLSPHQAEHQERIEGLGFPRARKKVLARQGNRRRPGTGIRGGSTGQSAALQLSDRRRGRGSWTTSITPGRRRRLDLQGPPAWAIAYKFERSGPQDPPARRSTLAKSRRQRGARPPGRDARAPSKLRRNHRFPRPTLHNEDEIPAARTIRPG